MKIQVKGRDIELKYGVKTLMYFENIANKSFSDLKATLSDTLLLFYSVLLSSDTDLRLTFDEFCDVLDEEPSLLTDFNTWVLESFDRNKILSKKIDDTGEGGESKN